ncbi:hypothetical protein [Pseudonocardia broussonetiae]|uniref:Uncharacterized protein n=1 Tax=Pseudonocardia broussonetiae TaxID=2736640 RepID=A0A6M6JIC7_9PSEU|nr:hypothetical protein [Pseudonocardia broussonetiae]QJY46667.1 hypothetical protein HOP40_13260 [Pseudonocardia broussonetiae]
MISYRVLTAVEPAQIQERSRMPHRHSRLGRSTHQSLKRIWQDRPKDDDTASRSTTPTLAYGCVAHDHCDRPLIDGCPIPLCAHHVREVYVYAQELISERLIPVVDELVAEYQQQDPQTG